MLRVGLGGKDTNLNTALSSVLNLLESPQSIDLPHLLICDTCKRLVLSLNKNIETVKKKHLAQDVGPKIIEDQVLRVRIFN